MVNITAVFIRNHFGYQIKVVLFSALDLDKTSFVYYSLIVLCFISIAFPAHFPVFTLTSQIRINNRTQQPNHNQILSLSDTSK